MGTSSLHTPSKSPDVISGMFNRIASTYDILNDVMTGGMHRFWKHRACQALNLKAGDTALDVCTGTGDLAATLAALVGPTGQVSALDFSANMLAIGKARFTEHPQIQWIQGDAMALPFEDNSFDGSIISFGLRNVHSVEQTLSEMVRVTKPGGWVINLDTASDCQNPIFWLYFKAVMPLLGQLFAKDKEAYTYLCQSTQTFETPEAICNHMLALKLTSIHTTSMGLGSVAMQVGQVPIAPPGK